MRPLRYILAALLAVLWTAPLGAQEPTGTIRGRVTDDATQQPLSGVTVTYGSRSALTQADGGYFLTGVPAGTATLRARFLGYAPATRSVAVATGQTVTADFAMTAQAIGLAEIVVTGYGEQRAGDITGAVSTVSSDEFNTGRVVSPAELIASKAPGVQVEDNNEPGGGRTIRIRGATSVNASSDPLYVIDGVPVGTGAGGGLSAGRDPLNFLNPADIENITVLRDASAAAIYGANAANGVVIITTRSRSGEQGRTGTRFEYTGSMSGSAITRRPDMLDAGEFRTAVQTYGSAQQINQLGTANTDWYDQVTQSGIGQEHNVSMTTASENMFYRVSLGYLNQDGIVRGTTAERVSLGMNYQGRFFSDRLDLSANLRGSRTNDLFTPGGVLSNAAQFGPTQPVMDSTSSTGYYEWPGNTLQSADNPVAILGLVSDRGTTYRSIGNVRADYRMPFLRSLRANVSLAYDIAKAERATFTPSITHQQIRNSAFGTDYRRNPSELNTVLETYLNYASAMGPGSVDATAGYSFEEFRGDYPSYEARDLGTDLLGGNGVTTATTVQPGFNVQESRLISFFGRVHYNIADRYLVAVSARRDGSSRFGPSNAWGTFPSVSAGWRLSEESFIPRIQALSDLKVRAAYGRTGNQAFGNYLQYTTYTFGDNQATVQFGNTFVPTIRPSAVDPSIKWEETGATNIGLDFGFWNQRLSGTIDWYNKNTEDLIFSVPVPAGTNYSNFVTTNIGSMRNRGIELSVNARLREGGPGRIGWTTSFNASHNSNELTSINPRAGSAQILVGGVAGGVGTTIQVLQAGLPINSFYVYEHIMENGRPIYRDVNGDASINEQDLYVDRPTVLDSAACGSATPAAGCVGLYRPDGIINFDDRRAFHDPAPKWILGFSNYLTRGSFDLSFTLRAYLGGYVYNNVASNMGTYSEVTRASPYNLHASVLETGFEEPQYFSDYYVEDASFLRMDNITLAYRFSYRGQPLRVFGTVQNAFTLTGYSGVDPTAGLNGIDNNIYPRSRTFTGGLSVQF